MTEEQIWVETLQKAINANFALVSTGTPMAAESRYENNYHSPRAMFYGIMTEKFGEEFARNFALNSKYNDYDKMIFNYDNLLLSKEKSPKKGSRDTWNRYKVKKQLILNYFKHGKK